MSHPKSRGDSYENISEIKDWLQSRTEIQPTVGIICGSGLGHLANALTGSVKFDYKDIPNFPVSTVAGHKGALVFGILAGKSVVCMQGRFHCYEGYETWKVAMPVRVMKLLGVSTLIVTNAAGGLNPNYKVGDLMIIKDHINWGGFSLRSPLVGPNDERFGPRFPALSTAYTPGLRKLFRDISVDLGVGDRVHEGVFSIQGGPCYETIAECRMLKTLGIDCTGMSTVPEVTVAAHCGLRILGLSLVTNLCILDYETTLIANHEEVVAAGKESSANVQRLVTEFVRRL